MEFTVETTLFTAVSEARSLYSRFVLLKIMKKEDETPTSSQGISVPGSDTTSGQNESSDESTTTGKETTGETETTSESSEQSEGE